MIDEAHNVTVSGTSAMVVPIGYPVGPWRVTAFIASGSWGSVYAAHRDGDDDEVALKFLPVQRLSPQQAANVRHLAERETECLAQLHHPGLMTLLETVTIDDPTHPELDGAAVLVMPRAAGSLRDVLAAATHGQQVDGAHRLLGELAAALAALHKAGWVHGDVKPGNVLLMADGSVRLADFGLAGELEGTHAYVPLLGSEDYLPPEWWTEHVSVEGVPARPSRDVWAIGVLAHQVLTGGQHPFPGASGRARSAAVRAYAQSPGDLRLSDALPAAWHPIIRDCLAPSQETRARHTAAELVARINALDPLDDEPLPPTRRRRRRRGRVLAAAAVGVTLVLAVLALAPEMGWETAAAACAALATALAAAAVTPLELRPLARRRLARVEVFLAVPLLATAAVATGLAELLYEAGQNLG